ncbi:ATP-binding protein [Actinoplanes teichomyceticus]|uniref:Histidine kinase/HSP90-like ATPase domain-containing protein n=1 Tax=Actinoplanes teichomyceticus TaxID=1867 RepID=A0A561VIE1_ACTTI|nr:ATP-binding protein [Actinoplanes teichomyceticus]TWG11381.1 hypothetical protein FHX34_106111 [Actinoplanes teichomyceticus]GIF15805.1 hypothetical protein Ate01nite_58370 [Actinoplanes teichomyceticus]
MHHSGDGDTTDGPTGGRVHRGRAGASGVVEDLLPVAFAGRHARNVVTESCLRWGLAHLLAPATLIVTELVSNVVMHAHTMMTLEIGLRGRFLRLAVHDGCASPPVLHPDRDPAGPGGLGLHLVASSSADWGYARTGGGKVVWADLPLEELQRGGATVGCHGLPSPVPGARSRTATPMYRSEMP